ncbi:hypothetical protein [Psychrobacillus sp.]|uniref:hypothetical protein n=1 Tax=Psychrobacillus sp. TaxID=1871623 RepID=UPI0028BDDF69|nr:hypothetical protein [Psychrobacillus sp.]
MNKERLGIIKENWKHRHMNTSDGDWLISTVEEQANKIESFQNLKEILEEANHGMSAKVEEQQKEIERLKEFAEMLIGEEELHQRGEYDTEMEKLRKKNKTLADNHFQQRELTQSRVDKLYKLNMQLHRENKRYREGLEELRFQIEHVSSDVEYLLGYVDKALAGESSCQSKN